MARGRMLSKSLSTSEKFAAVRVYAGELTEFTQLLFTMLVPHCDDYGRFDGDPFTVKHRVLPCSPRSYVEFGTSLESLRAVGLIDWYRVDGKLYLQVHHFERHQSGLHKRTKSFFPGNPNEIDVSGKFPEIPGNSRLTGTGTGTGTGTKDPPYIPPKGGRRRKSRSLVPGGSTCPHTPCCRSTKACIEKSLRWDES